MMPRARGEGPVVATSPGVPMASAGGTAFNQVVLDQIRAMPSGGGYSASHVATQRLGGSVVLTPLGFEVAAARAEPSYCSGATYLVFIKTISALQRAGKLSLDPEAQRALLISGQRDGQGIWGRWNANGPGTARLFHELDLGRNFSDYAEARPGDFMKIFWNDAVGRKEHGHSVVFLGLGNDKRRGERAVLVEQHGDGLRRKGGAPEQDCVSDLLATHIARQSRARRDD